VYISPVDSVLAGSTYFTIKFEGSQARQVSLNEQLLMGVVRTAHPESLEARMLLAMCCPSQKD